MVFPPDFKEFIELLNANGVRYLLVGGYTLAHYSRPKFTDDIDFWVESTEENAVRMMAAINAFGFASLGLSREDFTTPNQVIQLGMPPMRIDIMTSVSGVEFEFAYQRRINAEIDGLTITMLSLEDFQVNKRATGRKKDLADLDWLVRYNPLLSAKKNKHKRK